MKGYDLGVGGKHHQWREVIEKPGDMRLKNGSFREEYNSLELANKSKDDP